MSRSTTDVAFTPAVKAQQDRWGSRRGYAALESRGGWPSGIDANLRDDMALSELARVVSMSPGHFSHLFRQTVGVPPHRFVLERRIERAKALLRDTELPITEIAQRVGCASHSHLTVMFHRDTGVTPRDFRRRPGA